MKNKSSFLYKIVSFFAIIFAISLFLSFLGGIINPVKIKILYYFSFIFPYLLIVNLIFFVIFLLKLKKMLILPLLAILVNFSNINNLLPFFGKSKESDKNSWSLLSYNVDVFNLNKNNSLSDEDKFFNIISNENPDIVCFQEYYCNSKKSKIETNLKKRGYKYFSGNENKTRKTKLGNIIISKFPIINDSLIHFKNSGNSVVYADIIIDLDTVRIINFHLSSIGFDNGDGAIYDKILHFGDKQSTGKLKEGGLAMLKKFHRAFLKRVEQVKILRNIIESTAFPCFLAGDMNDVSSSYSYHQLSKNFSDTFVEAGSGIGKTYNGKYPAFRIDYILYPQEKYNCLNFNIIEKKLSDHYPIYSKFSRKK